ncbi:MAG: hypothetical protein ABSG17_07315 [Spirochaetia bacterium]
MKDFLVVRLLVTTRVYPQTKGLGGVDIRPAGADLADEIAALAESSRQFPEHSIDTSKAPRMVTIVEADDGASAFREAEVQFEEAIEFAEPPISGFAELRLTPIGFMVDLSSRRIVPLNKPQPRVPFPVGPVFLMSQGELAQIDQYQYAYAMARWAKLEAPQALKRSLIWASKARKEPDRALAFLFYWVSLESLFKLSPTHDLGPSISLLLGFPAGRMAAELPRSAATQLTALSLHRRCRRWLTALLNDARGFRNRIVHSGFRHVDFDRKRLAITIRALIELRIKSRHGLVFAA